MSKNDETNEEILSTQGRGDTFANVLERSISRRALLKGGMTASAAILAAPVLGDAEQASAQPHNSISRLAGRDANSG
jgi:secreted PhoX family phosphatase